MYQIVCECTTSSIGQMGHTIADRCKEHEWYICLNYTDKSALAEHCIASLHVPDFQSASVLLNWERLITEAVEIQLQNNTDLHLSPFQWQLALKLTRFHLPCAAN